MLELTFDQEPGDLVAFNYFNAWSKPERTSQRNRSRIQILLIAGVAIVGIRFFTQGWDWTLTGLIGISAIIYTLLLGPFVKMRVQRHIDAVMKKSPSGSMTGTRSWQIDREQIVVVLPSGNQEFAWKDIKQVEETNAHWMLYLDGKQALVLPKRALASEEEKSLWKGFVAAAAVA
ncbi:MAG: YcxB family protein [Bacteroidia bacterium]|nr:YcxB family protein [Bacteroidia bacterium]